jgi:hypothetical protein
MPSLYYSLSSFAALVRLNAKDEVQNHHNESLIRASKHLNSGKKYARYDQYNRMKKTVMHMERMSIKLRKNTHYVKGYERVPSETKTKEYSFKATDRHIHKYLRTINCDGKGHTWT